MKTEFITLSALALDREPANAPSHAASDVGRSTVSLIASEAAEEARAKSLQALEETVMLDHALGGE